MNVVQGATRAVATAANATTAAAGAVTGAAVNGIVGGAVGAADGIRRGLSAGSNSTPAALVTMGAIAATGLIEWPVVAAVGGAAVLVNWLSQNGEEPEQPTTQRRATKSAPRKATQSRAPRKRAANTS